MVQSFVVSGSALHSASAGGPTLACVLFTASIKLVSGVRAISDILAILACGTVCLLLAQVAWKMRDRLAYAFTGGPLAVLFSGFTARRILDLLDLRQSIPQRDPRYLFAGFCITLALSLGVILLSPFLRKLVRFGLSAEEQRQRFLSAAETNLHAFCLLTPVRSRFRGISDFKISFANAVAANQFGVERDALIGATFSTFFPSMKQSGMFRRLKYVAQTGASHCGRLKETTAAGKDLWLELRVVKTEDGIAVAMHDQSEERQRQRKLDEMNRFSQSIIEDAPFSIVAVNVAGVITAVNASTQVLTHFRRDELVGKHSLMVLHDPAEISARSVQMCRETGESIPAGFETLRATLGRRKNNDSEWTYVRKDGSKVAVHLAMTALRDPDEQITGYLAIAFDISERKALTDSITFLAHHDALTRLPNRALLNVRLEAAINQAKFLHRRVALFVVDVDHFKRVNDSLGHTAGDELLIAVGERLKLASRTTDLVARTGGDEFVVMMPYAGDRDDIMRSGQRILNSLTAPITVAGREVNVTGSVGVCIYPDLADDAVSLIRNADAAMYAVKHQGRNGFHAFSTSMLKANADRLELEADLRRALERNELSLHYQPQVNTRTRQITGVEALLRWKHPERGMVPPIEFIEAAEEGGMIVPMGEWVVRQACMQAKALQDELGRRFTIAVNLSPRQILQDNLFEVVSDALTVSGLAPQDLELEITENTLMISTTETLSTLARLRELGVRLAVDDFGTGFSSFKYILDYKVDRLKIDRSFVSKCPHDATAAAIVRTVIAMAHGLNMTVVAEGVETDEELAFLLRRRCDEAQGYRFGRPMPIDQLRELMFTQRFESSASVPVAHAEIRKNDASDALSDAALPAFS